MTVSSVSPTTATASTQATGSSSASTSSSSATLNYNDFLQLMIAELKNQDPTDPTDASQYMSQIASFTEVEQTMNGNSKLDALLTSMSISQADNLIGRTVTSADGTSSGQIVAIQVTSQGSVATLDNGTTMTLGSGVTIS